ncbi:hypothetical protein [Streptomyces silvisoli]|uniref:Uncharacterized protein n=1 Tax=Streptomyces silvisoli TaxID=3034235 RepID=A0ABT5ZIB2_9ACTN|nr:hypothetical protein [Streptomyces silvisoli]MDF3289562.1 hypothetical protein [Streptomyces silvisoli]
MVETGGEDGDAEDLAETPTPLVAPVGPRGVGAGRGGWARQVAETLRARQLVLLAALFGEPSDYIPDFVIPRPVSHEESVDAELHRIATARPARVRQEMTSPPTSPVNHGTWRPAQRRCRGWST